MVGESPVIQGYESLIFNKLVINLIGKKDYRVEYQKDK